MMSEDTESDLPGVSPDSYATLLGKILSKLF